MQAWLIRQVLTWILEKLGKLAEYFYKVWRFDHQADKAKENLEKAGTEPNITPEQKAKEQEDAFDHLVDTVNKP